MGREDTEKVAAKLLTAICQTRIGEVLTTPSNLIEVLQTWSSKTANEAWAQVIRMPTVKT